VRYGATAGCVQNHLRMGGTVHRDSHDAVVVHIERSRATPFAGGKFGSPTFIAPRTIVTTRPLSIREHPAERPRHRT